MMTPSTERKTRKTKKKIRRSFVGSQHFGDADFTFEDMEVIGGASWGEVCHSCCVHSPQEWVNIIAGLCLILLCLYLFGLGLEFLASGAKVMGGCAAGKLFGESDNPISGLMTGILATVLLQSSSTTTAIIVTLVGADHSVVSVQQGIYMVMGSNIGTTITNTIVSLGHFHDVSQLELAFAGATVHDVFNFLSVAILFPLEILTGYLTRLTEVLVRGADTEAGEKWEGPVKTLITPLAATILIPNKSVISAVAGGGRCEDYYPIECENPDHPTTKTCTKVGIIHCNKETGACPAFFQSYGTLHEDQLSGLVVFCIGLFVIFVALFALVVVMQRLLLGVSVRVMYKAINLNGYLLVAIGAGVTMLLQSSSTTTSFLTPIVGMGALGIEQMYSITVGANIGTTLTALLAALVTDGNDALQVALAHLMFNITAMMIWFPIPFVRDVPVKIARELGKTAKAWRGFTFLYLFVMYLLLPGVGLGLVLLFESKSVGIRALAAILSAILCIAVVLSFRWCCCLAGHREVLTRMVKRHKRYVLTRTLASDMDRLKRRVRRLLTDVAPRSKREFQKEETKQSETSGDSTSEMITRTDLQLRKQALEDLPDDMDFSLLALSTIYAHLGIDGNDELDESDVETSETCPKLDNDSNPAEEAPTSKRNKPSSKSRSLLEEIPLHYAALLVITVSLLSWGLIALFLHHSKAAVGAASFLAIVLGLCCAWLFHWFVAKDGKRQCLAYLDDALRREAAINSLATDMGQIKSDIKRVLGYYKLHVEGKKATEEKPAENDFDFM